MDSGRGGERVGIASADTPVRGGVSTVRSHHTRATRSLPQAVLRNDSRLTAMFGQLLKVSSRSRVCFVR
jgi:hypothetical protein